MASGRCNGRAGFVPPKGFSPPSDGLLALAKVSGQQLEGIAHHRAPSVRMVEDVSIFVVRV